MNQIQTCELALHWQQIHEMKLYAHYILGTRHLVTLPLWWSDNERGALLGLNLRELSGKLGKERLVVVHTGTEANKVLHLVGEAKSLTRDVDELTGTAALLADSKDTTLGHGISELDKKVLAKTGWPPLANLGVDTHELVGETVDVVDLLDIRDDLATEGRLHRTHTGRDTLSRFAH